MKSGLRVRSKGWDERWSVAMMSHDECDFEVGDVGNRSLTRLVGVWV